MVARQHHAYGATRHYSCDIGQRVGACREKSARFAGRCRLSSLLVVCLALRSARGGVTARLLHCQSLSVTVSQPLQAT